MRCAWKCVAAIPVVQTHTLVWWTETSTPRRTWCTSLRLKILDCQPSLITLALSSSTRATGLPSRRRSSRTQWQTLSPSKNPMVMVVHLSTITGFLAVKTVTGRLARQRHWQALLVTLGLYCQTAPIGREHFRTATWPLDLERDRERECLLQHKIAASGPLVSQRRDYSSDWISRGL
jgi:hypothetical protein